MSRRVITEEAFERLLSNDADLDSDLESGSDCESEDDLSYNSGDDFVQENNESSDDSEHSIALEEEESFTRESKEYKESDSMMVSKDGLIWNVKPWPTQAAVHRRAENILTLKPGTTRYAISRANSIQSAFELLMPKNLCEAIINYTNTYGTEKITAWQNINIDTFHAYIGILFLAGVYK